MKKLRFVVSLVTTDNDYQMEQAEVAEQTARRLGVEIQLMYSDSDAITQSQQLLKIIQSRSDPLPDGIIFEPVGGTALPQVARAAVNAGVAWVVMNRETDYVPELRRTSRVPCFSITSDHEEIGRIQGKQLAALLPKGGSVLYIQGPSENTAAKQRAAGMYETKPADIQLKVMKGNWTEGSAYKAVSSWLRLSTSRQTPLDVIAAQNDAMALGAKKAFQESSDIALRDHWLGLPYIGVDGVSKTGQAWVKRGLLSATVVVPPNTGKAIEMLTHALQTGVIPPERTTIAPRSMPSLDDLASAQVEKARMLST
ncbi:MAG TPA: sugar ABC transporter substrate-binding protein [Terriglobales bacterium]|jgi:ribose transport system substrate-binding protein